MKEKTTVETGRAPFGIGREDRILVLGSCFAAAVGERLAGEGYEVCLNPFGTLFNPASIASSLERLASGRPFAHGDAVALGAGAGLVGSFSHYTRCARPTAGEFLDSANAALAEASAFYKSATRVILTFGTAFVFRFLGAPDHPSEVGRIVSNCLKRPAREFSREMLSIDETVRIMSPFASSCGTFGDPSVTPKKVVYTVSPIRHMADGAHGHTVPKATLLLAAEKLASTGDAAYFPSYEILLDELRDYRWYAEDLVHPSPEAVDHITGQFKNWIL
ncbi:MAG: GSCFA domain-containing protein [Bacteroidales bacterium]|nr:GSCFA domain-containing protein [Bacteroidales bacterium]